MVSLVFSEKIRFCQIQVSRLWPSFPVRGDQGFRTDYFCLSVPARQCQVLAGGPPDKQKLLCVLSPSTLLRAVSLSNGASVVKFLFWTGMILNSSRLRSWLSETGIGPATINGIGDPSDPTGFFRGEEQYEFCDFFWVPHPT